MDWPMFVLGAVFGVTFTLCMISRVMIQEMKDSLKVYREAVDIYIKASETIAPRDPTQSGKEAADGP